MLLWGWSLGLPQLTHVVSGLNPQVAPCWFSTIRTLSIRCSIICTAPTYYQSYYLNYWNFFLNCQICWTTAKLLLRGSILRNTNWIYGLAVYTGRETKMVQNWKGKRQKRSCAEHSMNRFLLFYLFVLFGLSACSLIIEGFWNLTKKEAWYRILLEPTTTANRVSYAICKN